VALAAEWFSLADRLTARHVRDIERAVGHNAPQMIEARLLRAEALILRKSSRERGLDELRELEKASHTPGWTLPQRAALIRLRASAFHFDDRIDSASALVVRGLSLLEDGGETDDPEYATLLIWRSRHLRGGRRIAESIELLERSCRILECAGGPDDPRLLDARDYLASSIGIAGDRGRAVALYDRLLEDQRRVYGDRAPRLIDTFYRMTGELSEVGRIEDARRYCREGLTIAEDGQTYSLAKEVLMYAVLGILAMQMEDFAEAESVLSKTITLLSTNYAMDSETILYPRMNRAGVLYNLGRFEEAERELRAMAAPIEERHSTTLAISSGHWRGLCALARGDTASALAFLRRASEEDRDYRVQESRGGPVASTGLVDTPLALCHWLSGRSREAFALALRVEADSRQEIRRVSRAVSDADALALETVREDGLGLVLTALLAGRASSNEAESAFDAVVRSRAVILDAITARHIGSRTSKDSTAHAIADSLETLESVLTWHAMRPSDDTGVERDSLERRRRALTAQLASCAPLFALPYDGAVIGSKELRAALGARTLLVSFVRFDRHEEPAGSAFDDRRTRPWYLAFTLSSAASPVRVVDLGPADVLDAQIARWRDLAEGRDDLREIALARRALGDSLRARLWDSTAPPGSDLERVWVVPDGAVTLLPFAALPASRGGFVIESSAPIGYLTAERDLASAGSRQRRGDGLLVLGDPDFMVSRPVNAKLVSRRSPAAGWMRLAGAAETYRGKTSNCEEFRDLRFVPIAQSGAEARDIEALTLRMGWPCAVLVGPDASEESFKRLAPHRRIVHVASHGFALSDQCRKQLAHRETPLVRAGIALAGANRRNEAVGSEDGILTAEEVASLDLKDVECVVLSSCEGGIGEVVTGEGVLGMRRAFYEAGAGTLVSALWRVDDASTRAWMRQFYGDLLGGVPDPTLAAHRASLETLRRMKRSKMEPAPALWAPFVVSGFTAPGGAATR
jgi:CHAT domain-containing protein/tetratricopeptide (TPR) repeat protein